MPESRNYKGIVVYDNHDPTQKGVRYLTIDTKTVPPRVAFVYATDRIHEFYCPQNMIQISIKNANRLFEFRKV